MKGHSEALSSRAIPTGRPGDYLPLLRPGATDCLTKEKDTLFSETLGGKKEEEEEGERKGGCLSLSPAQSTAPPGFLTPWILGRTQWCPSFL